MKRPNTLHKVGLAILLLGMIAFWIYANFSDPASFIASYDPEYPYFLNSLLPFKREPYRYIDHPGTPIELLGTGFFTLTYPFPELKNEVFVHFHLARPGVFLRMARGFLLLSSLLCVYLLATKIFEIKDWKENFITLAIASSFFVFPGINGFLTLTIWSHNSFALPFGTLVLLLLLMRLHERHNMPFGELIAFGVAAGLLTTITIWFSAWVVGISLAVFFSFIFRERRILRALLAPITVIIGAGFGFIFGTLPILHEYLDLRDWIVRLMTHQGNYGLGEGGFSSLNAFIANLKSMATDSPTLLLALVLTLALVVLAFAVHRRRVEQYPGLLGIALGLSIQSLFALFFILKHPGAIYLLSIAATLPVLIGVVYLLLREVHPKAKDVSLGLGVILLLGFVVTLAGSFSHERKLFDQIHSIETEIESFKRGYATELGKDPDALMTFTGYGIPIRCLPLRFGDIYAAETFKQDINELCFYERLYDIFYGSPEIVESDKWDLLIIPEDKLPPSIEERGVVTFSDQFSLGYGRIAFVTPRLDR